MNKSLYDVSYFLITKDGEWYEYPHFPNGDNSQGRFLGSNFEALKKCDLLLPILHGEYGEDGTMQGFFEILGIPYVGCDHRSAANCMDKALTKSLCQLQGIKTAEFVFLTQKDWDIHRASITEEILEKLTFPVFVKANHLGSSVGLYKVSSSEELETKIDAALKFDNKVIVEQGICGREIEFAVYGNDRTYIFPPGEVITNGQVYDYDAKYGDNGFATLPAAALTEEQVKVGCELAKKCYSYLGCQGLTRIDFFLDESGTFWLNEMNPIPGFTKISLFPSICIENGLSFPALIDKLIVLGLHKHRSKLKRGATM